MMVWIGVDCRFYSILRYRVCRTTYYQNFVTEPTKAARYIYYEGVDEVSSLDMELGGRRKRSCGGSLK